MRPSVPKSLKILLAAILIGTLLPFPMYLGLSYAGLVKLYLWQPITYFLTNGGPGEMKVISLLFNLYMVWVFGLAIYSRKGTRSLYALFFGGGILSGIVSAAILWFFPTATLLIGATPAINALLMGWLMLHAEAQLRFFVSGPMKATYLILGIMGIGLFIDISNGFYLKALANSIGFIYGYLFSLIAWKCRSPFPSLAKFERFILRQKPGHKVYDFKTGRQL